MKFVFGAGTSSTGSITVTGKGIKLLGVRAALPGLKWKQEMLRLSAS